MNKANSSPIEMCEAVETANLICRN